MVQRHEPNLTRGSNTWTTVGASAPHEALDEGVDSHDGDTTRIETTTTSELANVTFFELFDDPGVHCDHVARVVWSWDGLACSWNSPMVVTVYINKNPRKDIASFSVSPSSSPKNTYHTLTYTLSVAEAADIAGEAEYDRIAFEIQSPIGSECILPPQPSAFLDLTVTAVDFTIPDVGDICGAEIRGRGAVDAHSALAHAEFRGRADQDAASPLGHAEVRGSGRTAVLLDGLADLAGEVRGRGALQAELTALGDAVAELRGRGELAAALDAVGDLAAAGRARGSLAASLVGLADLQAEARARGDMAGASDALGALAAELGSRGHLEGLLTGDGPGGDFEDACSHVRGRLAGRAVLVGDDAGQGCYESISTTCRNRFHATVAAPLGLGTLFDDSPLYLGGPEWPLDRFAVVSTTHDQAHQRTIGSGTQLDRKLGAFVVEIYVRQGAGDSGEARAYEVADAVVAGFRSVQDGDVLFRVPSVIRLGPRSGWWRLDVVVDFQADEVF